ncbi:MAG TPA: SGNH/GDSL hydrolase family protein [Chitinophagaceae bacterium]|nr:SGNH/GDSL hydrolase family protein [Chitinophagaceae bacterium]
MKILRNVIVLLVLLGLIALIKQLLLSKDADSLVFYFNLLTCLQLFFLGNMILWLILSGIKWFFKKKFFSFSATVIASVGLLAIGEIICINLMNDAGKVKGQLHYYLEEYYMTYERQVPEVRTDCAVYDSVLLYTYRPNTFCIQENAEFKDTLTMNSLGLRDDENSLLAPEIICLGDSYTMGWGVKQNESYPQQLEKLTGMKVLNAGISSYGTAREFMLLKRLDTSNLKLIIIQYCVNDIKENEKFLQNNFQLPISTREQYEESVRKHKWATKYYPFKKILTLTRIILKDKKNLWFNKEHSAEQAEVLKNYDRNTSYITKAAGQFIKILSSAKINVPVFVIDVNRYPLFDHHFIEEAKKPGLPNVDFLDISRLNNSQYYYPLDGHLNAKGHAELGKLIYQRMLPKN